MHVKDGYWNVTQHWKKFYENKDQLIMEWSQEKQLVKSE